MLLHRADRTKDKTDEHTQTPLRKHGPAPSAPRLKDEWYIPVPYANASPDRPNPKYADIPQTDRTTTASQGMSTPPSSMPGPGSLRGEAHPRLPAGWVDGGGGGMASNVSLLRASRYATGVFAVAGVRGVRVHEPWAGLGVMLTKAAKSKGAALGVCGPPKPMNMCVPGVDIMDEGRALLLGGVEGGNISVVLRWAKPVAGEGEVAR